jgi:hypothetical protein
MHKFHGRFVWAAIVAGFASFMATAAHATAFCYVKPTKDGYIALRAYPSKAARLIGRMRAGDEVMLGLQQKGRWLEVTWYRCQERHEKGFDAISGKGWVHVSLIEEECG